MPTSPDTRASSPLADRLRQRQPLVGLILKMTNPAGVELAGHLGFDLVLIDTEHGLNGGAELDHHLRAAEAARIPALVRMGTGGRAEIQRALDGGAAGIIIPQVDSAAAAREAVSLAHYPPFGGRGLATSTRAGRQGTVDTPAYLTDARKNTVVIAQIESRAGVANAAEILAVEGISAVWIGLSDLSLDLGHFGQPDHPFVAAAVDAIIQAAQDANMPLMVIADTAEDGEKWIDRGAQVLLVNLLSILARGLRTLKDAHHTARIERITP
ncbi:MAG: aldolase/citrate lyase family protein [Actinomycetota bacterium]|nr:aldolase/citrate lyase family protein [Actinomycetota bacterium]